MAVSCIFNGSKKILLWTGASCISFSVIELVSTAVFSCGCDYKGIPHRERQAKFHDMIPTYPSALLALILPVLPGRKSIACTILVTWSVFAGLAGINRLEQAISEENNELLSLLPTHSFMDRFCSFKTRKEAMEFHNVNNKLLAAGNRKEALKACTLFIKKGTTNTSITEYRLTSGIRCAQKIKNYSILFSLLLLVGPYKSLQSLCVVSEYDVANYKYDVANYKLMCELFGYQEVDRSILIMLYSQYYGAKKLHSFWLRNLESTREGEASTFQQLRAREQGAFRQPSLKLDNSRLGLLLHFITIRQDKTSLRTLLGYGVRLQDIDSLDILFKMKGVDTDIEYFRLLVENGAELFNDRGYSPIDRLLRSIMSNDTVISENSDVYKILHYLVKKGATYEPRYVPYYLKDQMAAWRSSTVINTTDQN